jgi:hypothetical protein
MPSNASDLLVESLISWGVDTVFGLPGDGINGIMEALRTRQDRIRFIQARHEEGAAFMACAYAKWTGKIGCCLATTGPGGVHLLNGLYDAKFDRAPVLAITGLPYHDLPADQHAAGHRPCPPVFRRRRAYRHDHRRGPGRECRGPGLPHRDGASRRGPSGDPGRRPGADAGRRQGLATQQGDHDAGLCREPRRPPPRRFPKRRRSCAKAARS